MRTTSFGAILLAANLGEDADIQLVERASLPAPDLWTLGNPEEWLHRLLWRERIDDTAERLVAASMKPDEDTRTRIVYPFVVYVLFFGRARAVKDRIHIRNAEAAHLARALEALRHYRPSRRRPAPRKRLALWRRLLREDRKRGTAQPETPIEALYDDITGLPR